MFRPVLIDTDPEGAGFNETLYADVDANVVNAIPTTCGGQARTNEILYRVSTTIILYVVFKRHNIIF
jgi:hypothetical protein